MWWGSYLPLGGRGSLCVVGIIPSSRGRGSLCVVGSIPSLGSHVFMCVVGSIPSPRGGGDVCGGDHTFP